MGPFVCLKQGHLAKEVGGHKNPARSLLTESNALAQAASTWRKGCVFSNLYKGAIRVSDHFMGNIALRLVMKCGMEVLEQIRGSVSIFCTRLPWKPRK